MDCTGLAFLEITTSFIRVEQGARTYSKTSKALGSANWFYRPGEETKEKTLGKWRACEGSRSAVQFVEHHITYPKAKNNVLVEFVVVFGVFFHGEDKWRAVHSKKPWGCYTYISLLQLARRCEPVPICFSCKGEGVREREQR